MMDGLDYRVPDLSRIRPVSEVLEEPYVDFFRHTTDVIEGIKNGIKEDEDLISGAVGPILVDGIVFRRPYFICISGRGSKDQ